ncbi:MAG: hypothetical protein HUJ26_09990 [Planctomycetaceae bacterium]|nr:hypothetical protein [Planctomycetaceae bacterium]
MISNVKEQASKNAYIQKLRESLIARELDSADCLILAHQDDVLAKRLAPISKYHRTLAIHESQAEWHFDESELAAAIGWALREGGIRSLYICGHTFGFSKNPLLSDDRFSEYSDLEKNKDEIADRLWMLGRLMGNQKRLQNAKNHFADQVHQILELPVVQRAIQRGNLKIHALFFLAQAGTFMSFDPNSGEFSPLIPSDDRL